METPAQKIWQLHIPLDDSTRVYWKNRAKLLNISPAQLVGLVLSVAKDSNLVLDGRRECPREPLVADIPNLRGLFFKDPLEEPPASDVNVKERVSEDTLQNKNEEVFSRPVNRDKKIDFSECPEAKVETINLKKSRKESFSEVAVKYLFPGDFLEEDCLLAFGNFLERYKWLSTSEEIELQEAKEHRKKILDSWISQRDSILQAIGDLEREVSKQKGQQLRFSKIKLRSLYSELSSFEEKTRWDLRDW